MEDEKKEIALKAMTLPEMAKRIVITTNVQYLDAVEFLRQVKAHQKKINDTFDPITNAAWKAYKTAKGEKTKLEAASKEAEIIVEPLIAEWEEKQERLRAETERRLQAIAIENEEERRFKEAIEAEQRGDKEEARAIMEEPIQVAPVVLSSSTPKVDGVHTQKVWKYRVVDLDKVPRIYMMLDAPKVGTIVRGLKDKTQIEGIEVYYENIVVVRNL